jgi:hypothetical protein
VHGGCWFTLALGHLLGTPALGRGLAQVKNGDEQYWKKKFHAANGKAQHALMNCTVFFLFEEWVGGEGFFVFFSYSQTVPKYIPNDVPNGNTSVLSHMVCPKFNSHVYKLQRWNPGGSTFVSILRSKRGVSIGTCPMFQRNLLMGQSIWLLWKKTEKKL